jgi:transposase
MKKMKKVIKILVGVDVSKDKFDGYILSIDTDLDQKILSSRVFENNKSGFSQFMLWIEKYSVGIKVEVILEATGVYHERLCMSLLEGDFAVFLATASRAKSYKKSAGLKSKTDKIDAKGLAMMGISHKFKPMRPIAKFYYELRQWTRHHQALQEQKTIITNQQHALMHSSYVSAKVLAQNKKLIALIEKQIKECADEMTKLIEGNEEVKRKVAHIITIKGIAILSIATLIAETNGFEDFDNANQLTSYAGYDVIENQSGKHVGKTKISKQGNSRIRRILHMPGLNVVRYGEPVFVEFFNRILQSTKITMKAYVAVQKKLLLLVYSLWKQGVPYERDYQAKLAEKALIKKQKCDLEKCSTAQEGAGTSGNEETNVLFLAPVVGGDLQSIKRTRKKGKKIVPSNDDTTQDEHQYKVSTNVLFLASQS